MQIKELTMPDLKTISCVGDSITAGCFDEEGLGWVSRLSQKIAQKFPLKYLIYNFGISDNTSLDCWHTINSSILHSRTDILIIHVGVNDVCIKSGCTSEQNRIALLDSEYRWFKIIDMIKRIKIKTIIIGPLPVEYDVVKYPAFPTNSKIFKSFIYKNSDILEYNNMLDAVCKQENTPFLRLFETWEDKKKEGLFTDGLHPNSKGHQLLEEQIFNKLTELQFI